MSKLIGTTVKMKGYKGVEMLGIIVNVDKETGVGKFVGYVYNGNPTADDVKAFQLHLEHKRYEHDLDFKRDLGRGILYIDPVDINRSRMPKPLGDVVREVVKIIERGDKVENKGKEDAIVIELSKQKEYLRDITERFEREIGREQDLDMDAYFTGVEFFANKGFYYIKREDVKGKGKEVLEKTSDSAIKNVGIFSQDLIGGSASDIYSYVLARASKDYYLFINIAEYDEVMDKVMKNINETAIYPERIRQTISKITVNYGNIGNNFIEVVK